MRRGRVLLPALVLAASLACREREAAPAAGAATRRDPAAAPGASVLLVTFDTLRPDALGWVAGSNATPAIDRLAAEGFRFPAAVAPVPLTFPSHATILTGVLPHRMRLRDNGQTLGPTPPTLAEMLRAQGYSTAAFVSGYPLAGAFGLDRGFDSYDDRFSAGEGTDLERRAPETSAAAVAWLSKATPPWFAWVHYYDPHFPYEPPRGFARAGPRGAYDGEVAFADRAVADLLAAAETSAGAKLLTVFAADHGESLGEHGEGTHGFFVYDSTVLVPLVFRLRGAVSPGESRFPARLADVTPTILELVAPSAGPSAGIDGRSLVSVLRGAATPTEPAYVETWQPWLSYGWAPLKSVRHEGWKLIVAPRPELYDLARDPAESRDVFAENRDRARELETIRRKIEALPLVGTPGASADAEAIAKLRALGYVGAGGDAGEPPASGLRDPKDSRELRDLLTEADVRLRAGDRRGAVSQFDAVLARDLSNRFALMRSAAALIAAGEPARAVPRLRKVIDANPEQPEARSALAQALVATGRAAEAVPHAMEATRLQPRRAAAWADLGNALGVARRVPEAVQALERAVELDPGDPKLLARLAFAKHAAGRVADAAADLERVATMQGLSFPYSGSLGILLADLGRPEEARRRLAASRPGEGDFAEARLRLALLELARGDRDAARRALSEALAASPGLSARVRSDPRLAPLAK